jgi:hypothetical protein
MMEIMTVCSVMPEMYFFLIFFYLVCEAIGTAATPGLYARDVTGNLRS